MNKKFQSALAVAAALAGTTIFASSVQAVELKISGQLNRAIMTVDDGEDTETYFVDNTNSSSRFRFAALGDLTDEIEAGALYEMEFESNPSNAISKANPSIAGELQGRKAEVFFRGNFGEVRLGQGSGAADGLTQLDLSATGAASLMGRGHLIGGGTAFLDDGVPGSTIGATLPNFDFEGRYDRVAYHTPSWGPLLVSASAGRKDEAVYEVGTHYASDFSFGKVLAGVGYSTAEVEGPAGSNDTVGGGASILLSSGLNAAVSYSQRENDAGYDANQTFLRLGYTIGKHAASVDFAVAEDRVQEGDESEMMGVNYVYAPVPWLELFATLKRHSLDRDGADFDDITIAAVGSRLKF